MDRLDAELLGDELADEGEGLLGGGVGAAGRGAHVVAVDPADAVAVVAVGDEDVVGRHVGTDRGDAFRVRDALDDVLDTVDGDGADALARFRQQCGEPGRQRQAPDR